MEIASLEVLWWGVSAGGRHYNGWIRHGEKKIELIRKLSRKEAKQYAQEEGHPWHHEKETNKFETQEDLEKFALKWCKANLGKEWLLLMRDHYNPNRAVGGMGAIVPAIPAINQLAELWEGVSDFRRRTDTALWDSVYGLWKRLLAFGGTGTKG